MKLFKFSTISINKRETPRAAKKMQTDGKYKIVETNSGVAVHFQV